MFARSIFTTDFEVSVQVRARRSFSPKEQVLRQVVTLLQQHHVVSSGKQYRQPNTPPDFEEKKVYTSSLGRFILAWRAVRNRTLPACGKERGDVGHQEWVQQLITLRSLGN